MPSKRRPISLLGPLARLDHDDPPPIPSFPMPPYLLHTPRTRTQSLRSGLVDEVFVFSNSSNSTINLPITAPLHGKMTRVPNEEVPSYISSRSANSLISFSRPTRIQAVSLHYLNKILDELLLHILSSAKSLATDRIKTDGMLKVLGGQTGSGSGAGAVLAKNAVLEAELELRNYLDGQRKEGGKVPLGLSATSRWDGTATFPVQKAYEALRIRCQFYSTLGDLEDPSPHLPQDQNIMSAEGRPIATITPGVAIYVTALLEFVAEHILQNVGRVIERDNSDEAGVSELKKAMEEDEGTVYWWNKMATRTELLAKEKEELAKVAKGRVGKPWKVPEASEWDEAAGRKKFQRQSLTTAPSTGAPHLARLALGSAASSSYPDHRGAPSAMSSSGHESRDSSIRIGQRVASPLHTPSAYHTDVTNLTSNVSTDTHHLARKPSTDKGWFGKKRGSIRASSDMSTASASGGIPFKGTVTASENQESEDMSTSDDFDSVMMSNQTMRVSLTPNRLRSIEVTKEKTDYEEMDDKRTSRRRPGTLSPLFYRDGEQPSRSALTSPSPTLNSRFSTQQEELRESPSPGPPRSTSRQGSVSVNRPAKKGAPPSAYRAVSHGEPALLDADDDLEDNQATRRGSNRFASSEVRLRPRNETRDDSKQETSVKDMVDMFNSTPPLVGGGFTSSGRDSRMSQSAMSVVSTDNGSISRKSALTTAGGKVRSLFGKITPSSSTSIAPIPGDSQDSLAKIQSPARHIESDFVEEQQLRESETKLIDNANGLAITGAASGVTLDALTKGLLEGHERATKVTSVPKTNRKQPQSDNGMQSKEISNEFVSEPVIDNPGLSNETASQVNNGLTSEPTSSGMVGLYQDARGNSSTSELSLNKEQAGKALPNRKVPWTYSRQSSSNGRRLSGTPGSIGIARVGSGGSSSLDHGSAGENVPPSAWSHGNTTTDPFNVNDARTTTPSFITTGSPRSPTPSTKPSDTARTLAQLNQKMKGASSVEECRFLLTQALAIAAAAVRNEFDQPTSVSMIRANSALSTTMPNHTRDNDSIFGEAAPVAIQGEISDEEAANIDKNGHEQLICPPMNSVQGSKQRVNGETIAATSNTTPRQQAIETIREQLSTPVKHRNLMLPMAVGYNDNEDLDAPSYKQQGYLVAWLLDGQEVDSEVSLLAPLDSTLKVKLSSTSLFKMVNSSDERESFSSADDHGLTQEDTSSRRDDEALHTLKEKRRQSNVDSVVSVYRDADSEIGK